MATDTVIPGALAELWRHPDPASTPMTNFLQHVNSRHGLDLADYAALHKWSIDNVAAFWEDTWHFVGIKAARPFDEVSVDIRPLSARDAAFESPILLPGPRILPG